GLPFEPPPLEVTFRLTIAGVPALLRREVVYRYRDQGIGEIRRPIFVTQPFDVAVTPDLVVWPIDGRAAAGAAAHFTVTVTNRGRARLDCGDPRRAHLASYAHPRGLRARSLRPRARGAPGSGGADRAAGRRHARPRRPGALRRDRGRQPRLRDRPRAGGEQRA